jgi:hypothetical protein
MLERAWHQINSFVPAHICLLKYDLFTIASCFIRLDDQHQLLLYSQFFDRIVLTTHNSFASKKTTLNSYAIAL